MTGRQDSDVMILMLLKSTAIFLSFDWCNMAKRWKLVKTYGHYTTGYHTSRAISLSENADSRKR